MNQVNSARGESVSRREAMRRTGLGATWVYAAPTLSVARPNPALSSNPGVSLMIVGNPPASITTPGCGGAQPMPTAAGGSFSTGAQAGQDVGVTMGSSTITVKLVGNDNTRCQDCNVGFIQNVLSESNVSTYQTGATITASFPGTGACALPLVDSLPGQPDFPWYQVPGPFSGMNCNVNFDVWMRDRPGQTLPLEKNGKKLQTHVRTTEFVTWLVLECPSGSGRYEYVHHWTWKIEHDYTIVNNDGTTAGVMAGYKACATTTGNGAGVGAHVPVTTGMSRNDCVVITETGF